MIILVCNQKYFPPPFLTSLVHASISTHPQKNPFHRIDEYVGVVVEEARDGVFAGVRNNFGTNASARSLSAILLSLLHSDAAAIKPMALIPKTSDSAKLGDLMPSIA